MQVRSRAALRPDTRQLEYHTGDTATSSPGKRWQFRIGGISRPASLVIPTKAGIQGFLATLEFYSLLALLDSGLRRNDEFAVSVNINSELLRQAHLNSSSNCAVAARKESRHPVRRHATVTSQPEAGICITSWTSISQLESSLKCGCPSSKALAASISPASSIE